MLHKVCNTKSNIWINANAGSGKTRSLISRIISLILHGTSPQKILCLTYTNSAGSEIKSRIVDIFLKWKDMNNVDLESSLKRIIGGIDFDLSHVREVLNNALRTYEMIQICTIHSFAYQILNRFGDIQFRIANDYELSLIKEDVRHQVVESLSVNESDHDIEILLENMTLNMFHSILDYVMENPIVSTIDNANICEMLGVDPDWPIDKDIHNFVAKIDIAILSDLAGAMMQYSNTISKRGIGILRWIKLSLRDRIKKIDVLIEGLLNQALEPLGNFPTIGFRKSHEHLALYYEEISRSISDLAHQIQDYKFYILNRLLPRIINTTLSLFSKRKEYFSVIDYNDILQLTHDMLSDPEKTWISMEIDKHIEHILIDEAQDVNLLSWRIIQKITEEFFIDSEIHNNIRTIFVVGDEKQSIFSFQGANINEFRIMKDYFHQKSISSRIYFEYIRLNSSYRSSSKILDFIDQVFSDPKLRKMITLDPELKHIPIDQKCGFVRCIEVIETTLKKQSSWIKSGTETNNKMQHMVNAVVDTVNSIKADGINANDVMIIVRNLTNSNNIISNIKDSLLKTGIKSVNIDKLRIDTHPVFRDILSLCNVALYEYDDYNTACFMRSLFINWSLNDIATLCINRQSTLLNEIYINDQPFRNRWKKTFQNLIDDPYHTLMTLLTESEIEKHAVNLYGQGSIKILHHIIENIVPHAKYTNLHRFVNHMSSTKHLISGNDKLDGISIITAHSAKGRESRVVILLDLINDIGTSARLKRARIVQINDKNAIMIPGIEFISRIKNYICNKYDNVTIEEEMRLFYVAITRARERLYIIGKKSDKNCGWFSIAYNALNEIGNPSPK